MVTETCELVACTDATPHRIVWRGNEPRLLDHGRIDLDAEIVLTTLGGRSLTCVDRVRAWLATGVRDVAALVDVVTAPVTDDHGKVLWSATGVDDHDVRQALQRSGLVSVPDLLRAREEPLPPDLSGAVDDGLLSSAQARVWHAAVLAGHGRWACPACGSTRRVENAWQHWNGIIACYWLSGRCRRDGWRRTSRWYQALVTAGLAEIHLQPAKKPHWVGGTYEATFVRSTLPGVTTDHLIDTLNVVVRDRRRRTYADAAAIVARLSPADIVAVAEGDRSPLQATTRVEAA